MCAKTLVWRSFYAGTSGYISASTQYPLAARKAGIETFIDAMDILPEKHPLFNMQYKGEQPDILRIVHQIPIIEPYEKGGYFTVTEFDRIAPDWVDAMKDAKVIMTQSNFCKNVFAREGIGNIHIVPYPIADQFVPQGGNLKSKIHILNKPLSDFDFVFGSVFEWVARKKPELMWQAFLEEFPLVEYPNVAFLNKMIVPKGSPHEGMRDWRHRIPKDPRLASIGGSVPDMSLFYRSLDCYCSPTAGEGWGATLSEAMCCGIPSIGSRHSGNLDFMTDTNSYLADVGPWTRVGKDPTNYIPLVQEWQQWRLPKVESIRKCMRDAYELKMARKSNPRAAEGPKIRKMLEVDAIGAAIKKAYESVS